MPTIAPLRTDATADKSAVPSRSNILPAVLGHGLQSHELDRAAIQLAGWSLYADCHLENSYGITHRVCENFRWVHED